MFYIAVTSILTEIVYICDDFMPLLVLVVCYIAVNKKVGT